MRSLLDKTRKMNVLLKTAATDVDFHAGAKVVRDTVGCNAYVLDDEGKVLGYALMDDFDCKVMTEDVLAADRFPKAYNEGLVSFQETVANIKGEGGVCVFKSGVPCIYPEKLTTVLPVVASGKRLGTLVLARAGAGFEDEDLILAEHAATVMAMEILRHQKDRAEEETRRQTAVRVALGSLSFSELNAMRHIFEALGGSEGCLVASKVADRVGITRSVIVNALRKFESAGVIESRSLGMKGTYIKVLNENLLEEMKRFR